jgi:hypothetical protein
MVAPLLQSRPEVQVKVLLRQRSEVRCDIRLLVEDTRALASKDGRKVSQWRSTG